MIDRETILGFLILRFDEFAAWCESESVALAIVEQLKREVE